LLKSLAALLVVLDRPQPDSVGMRAEPLRNDQILRQDAKERDGFRRVARVEEGVGGAKKPPPSARKRDQHQAERIDTADCDLLAFQHRGQRDQCQAVAATSDLASVQLSAELMLGGLPDLVVGGDTCCCSRQRSRWPSGVARPGPPPR